MKRIVWTLLSALLFGCSTGPVANLEKDLDFGALGVPTDLADRFATVELKEDSGAAEPKQVIPDPKKKKDPSKPTAKKKKANKKTKATAKNKFKTKFKLKNRRANHKVPFYPGERTLMSLTYFGVEAGTLELRVLPYKYVAGRKVYHFSGLGRSSSVFALFYRVNDLAESFMDFQSLFSHKFQLKVDESLQQRDLVEFYDYNSLKVHYWEKLIHKRKGFRLTQFSKEIKHYTQDAISAAFFLRALPLEVGKTFTFPVVSNGKSWMVTAKVIRKEDLQTDAGLFSAFVIKPETRFEGVLKKKGDIFFWISADKHRSFLKIDAKVKIGKVIAYLKELEYGEPDQ